MSPTATVLSLFSPLSLTVALPAFSSTFTTVASAKDPLLATLTLSPALNSALTDGLASGVGLTAGVGAWPFVFAFAEPLVFELLSVVAGSQAVKASDKSITAKILVV